MSSSLESIPVYERLDEYEFQDISYNNFPIHTGPVTTITLVDENGNSKVEKVPKQYWGKQKLTDLYLKQRMEGIIKQGDEINLEKMKFTSLDVLEYTDERVEKALKTFIKARDLLVKNETPEEIEAVFFDVKKQIMEINPPTKESLQLLYLYAIALESLYELKFKDYEKGAQVFVDCGLLMLETYPSGGIYLVTEACKIMSDHGKYKQSHKYYTRAVNLTLKYEKYDKALELLESEVKLYGKEHSQFEDKGETNGMQRCVLQTWGRICGICVVKIKTQGVDIANMFFEKKLDEVENSTYKIPAKVICEDIINAFRDNDNKLLETVQKSSDIGRYLPGYMNDLINGLSLKQSGTRSLNKKHSTEQL